MSNKKIVTSSDAEYGPALDVFEAAFNGAHLSAEHARELSVRGKSFQEDIVRVFPRFEPKFYPDGYCGAKPIQLQIEELSTLFKSLNPKVALRNAKRLPDLPTGAEGWFAIPLWEKLAPTYGEAMVRVGQKMRADWEQSRDRSLVGPWHMRQPQEEIEAFCKIMKHFGESDFIILPAQFGLLQWRERHEGARFYPNEFQLGLFSVLIMLLTHPERLKESEDLGILCWADDRYPGRYDKAQPHLHAFEGKITIDAGFPKNVSSVTAFVPACRKQGNEIAKGDSR